MSALERSVWGKDKEMTSWWTLTLELGKRKKPAFLQRRQEGSQAIVTVTCPAAQTGLAASEIPPRETDPWIRSRDFNPTTADSYWNLNY